jgi:hypothetical protein
MGITIRCSSDVEPDELVLTSREGTPVRPETYLRSFNKVRDKAATLSDEATPPRCDTRA